MVSSRRYMKTFGVVSYNIHCNFRDCGSVVWSRAMSRTIVRLETTH